MLLAAEAVAAGTGGGVATWTAEEEALATAVAGEVAVGTTDVDTSVSFLDEDMSTIDTSMPLIKDGPCKLLLVKLEKLPNKKGTGFLLKFTLKATEDMETVKGDLVHVGYPVFKQISITPTPQYDEDAIKRAVALFVQSAKGTKLFPLSQYEGMILPCRMTIRKERTDKDTGDVYPASNEVKFVKE